jgi:hypothetical protein
MHNRYTTRVHEENVECIEISLLANINKAHQSVRNKGASSMGSSSFAGA